MVFAEKWVSELQRSGCFPSFGREKVRRQVQSLQYSHEVIYTRLFFLGSLTEAPLRID